jgi:dolichol kinase
LSDADKVTISGEILRKLIHLACSVIPVLYYFYFKREQIVVICVLITVIFLIAEIIRTRFEWGRELYKKWFFPLLREGEKDQNLTGATHLFLSVTVSFLIFEKHIAIPAVLILIIADAMAAIVGKFYGKHQLLQKSWQGSATFFVISLVVLFTNFSEQRMILVLIALIVTIVELLPLPFSDNYSVPLSAGLLLLVFNF